MARVWENDTELDIANNRINRATGHLVYQKKFYRTKFCICPGGSQVNSARIADSIHYGCIPGENTISLFFTCIMHGRCNVSPTMNLNFRLVISLDHSCNSNSCHSRLQRRVGVLEKNPGFPGNKRVHFFYSIFDRGKAKRIPRNLLIFLIFSF